MVLIILSTPLLVITFVKFVTPIFNDVVPYNFRTEDSPLYSYMRVNKNFDGYLFSYNIHNGLKKEKHSTNSYGLRSPKIDFKKDLVLISGDSVPFGVRLNDTDTLGWILNKINSDYHFINAGIPGKAIAHNLLTLEYFIKEAKIKKTRIKYFINYVNADDFKNVPVKNYEVVLRRWNKSNLSKKEKLMDKFPALLFYYINIKNPSGSNKKFLDFIKGSFIEDTELEEDIKNRFNQGDIYDEDKYYQIDFSKQRKEDSLKILKICKDNNIKIITVITPNTESDLFSKYSHSNELEEKLREIGYKDLLLVKNVFRNDENLIGITNWIDDYTHFNQYAMHSLSKAINDYIKSR
tara:strand:+ start:1188 stop:2237 length:1050 start_codon:yes stop_codon:yes gene_type:complete